MRNLVALVACLAIPLAGLLASPALARSRSLPAVHGSIEAIALAGPATIIARTPKRGPLRIERYERGKRPQLLLRAKSRYDTVRMAASPEALAVSLQDSDGADDDELSSDASIVMIGGSAGPLREVSRCGATPFTAPAIAIDGRTAAWAEGGCIGGKNGFSTSRATLATGDVAPGAAARRLALPEGTVLAGLTLHDGAGIASVLVPRFFLPSADLRPYGPDGLGEPVQTQASGTLIPTGRLGDGSTALLRSRFDTGEDQDESGCESATEVLTPAGDRRAQVNVGGCVGDDSDGDLFFGLSLTPQVAAGNRVITLVQTRNRSEEPGGAAVTSISPGRSGVSTIVAGRRRAPLGLTTDGPRVAWWQPRCDGDEEVVISDAPVPSLRACTLRVTRRALTVRRGRISVPITCGQGCSASFYDETSCGFGRLRRFVRPRGRSRVFLRVPRGALRAGRLILRVQVENGPTRRVTINLRGREVRA